MLGKRTVQTYVAVLGGKKGGMHIIRTLSAADGLQIDLTHLQKPGHRETPMPQSGTTVATSASLEDMERAYIAKLLTACGWNLVEAGRVLKISRSTLYNKIARYGLER